MLLLAFRSLFFIAVIFGYSTGIWRLINDYFRREFKTYLDEEVKKNKYLLVDPAKGATKENVPLSAPVDAGQKKIEPGSAAPVTANRLLDEIILGFGRLFTTRNEKERDAGQGVHHTGQLSAPPPSSSSSTTSSSLSSANKRPEAVPRSKAGRVQPSSEDHHCIPDPGGGGQQHQQQQTASVASLVAGKSETKFDNAVIADGGDPVPKAAAAAQLHVGQQVQQAEQEGEEDEEQRWIGYWKTRGPGKAVQGDDGGGGGYCTGGNPTTTSGNNQQQPSVDNGCEHG